MKSFYPLDLGGGYSSPVYMDFGEALKAVKNENKIARKGWNGKNMFVHLVPGDTVGRYRNYIKYLVKQLRTTS